MNQNLSIPCPDCAAELSIPSAGYLGKTVTCPQCNSSFLLRPPATDELPEADVVESVAKTPGSLPGPSPTPTTDPAFPFAIRSTPGSSRTFETRREASPAGPGRRRNWLLIITATTVAALALVLLVLLLPGPALTSELDYMPDNTEFFVRVRVNELLESPLSGSILQNISGFQELVDGILQRGMSPREIESIALGISGYSMAADKPVNSRNVDFTVLVRFLRPADTDNLAKIFTARNRGMREPIKTKLNERTFYVSHPYDNNQRPVALYVIDSTTFLFGSEQSVRNAVKQQGRSGASTRFHFLESSHQAVIGFIPHTLRTFDNAISGIDSNQTASFREALDSMRGALTGVAMGISIQDGIEVSTLGEFTGKGAARTFIREIDNGLDTTKDQISRLGSVASGPQALATRVLSAALRNIHSSSEGRLARIRFSIPRTTVDLAMAVPGKIAIPGIGLFFPARGADQDSPAMSADEDVSLEDAMTKLVLQGVTDESLAGIKSMFDDPEYVLMDYLDRWLTDRIGAAVTITASIAKEEAFVEIAGVDDVEALAEKIDFAEVLEVNSQRKMVTARWKPPKPE